MIASIVIGRGNRRQVFDIPATFSSRKEHVAARLKVGNLIKSKYLWPDGRGYKAALNAGRKRLSLAGASSCK